MGGGRGKGCRHPPWATTAAESLRKRRKSVVRPGPRGGGVGGSRGPGALSLQASLRAAPGPKAAVVALKATHGE